MSSFFEMLQILYWRFYFLTACTEVQKETKSKMSDKENIIETDILVDQCNFRDEGRILSKT